ncbi:hypothetical protein BDZ91DRAFT_792032 [Kalaharituber pfeilii]|nr:hypothetical protein BDZ91DRAFT_792032 [Kalaharituber pfeilii]
MDKYKWERRIEAVEDEGWKYIYMDGSRINGIIGKGIYDQDIRASIYMGMQMTVNDAKLQQDTENRKSLNGVAHTVRKAWEVRAARGDLDVSIIWVNGLRGNKEADKAAMMGAFMQYQDEIVMEAAGQANEAPASGGGAAAETTGHKNWRAEDWNGDDVDDKSATTGPQHAPSAPFLSAQPILISNASGRPHRQAGLKGAARLSRAYKEYLNDKESEESDLAPSAENEPKGTIVCRNEPK